MIKALNVTFKIFRPLLCHFWSKWYPYAHQNFLAKGNIGWPLLNYFAEFFGHLATVLLTRLQSWEGGGGRGIVKFF